MPRRSTASQSQTQTQRTNGRRKRVEEEEDDEDVDEHVNEEDEVATQTQGGGHIENLRKKGAALAKMAMTNEYSRRPLKRTDVTTLLLGGQSRQFPLVLREAQEILRGNFGMELRELRPRTKLDAVGGIADAEGSTSGRQAAKTNRKQKGRALNDIDEEEEDAAEEEGVEEEDAMPAAKKQKKQPSTGTYILRNVLPAELLKSMSVPSPLPAFDAAGRRILDEDEVDSGALLQWEKGDGSNGHIGLLGLRSLIMILILGSGRVLSDDYLHAYLKRLKIHRETPLHYVSPDSRDGPLTLDKFLELLAKQNYLEKVKIPNHAPGAEGHKIEWRWGSREVEFTEQDAAKLAQAILIDSQEAAFDDEATQGAQARNEALGVERNTAEKARARLKKDLEKAAGSELRGDD